jgi:hypothetical protein
MAELRCRGGAPVDCVDFILRFRVSLSNSGTFHGGLGGNTSRYSTLDKQTSALARRLMLIISRARPAKCLSTV